MTRFQTCPLNEQNCQRSGGTVEESDGNQNSEAVLNLLESMKPKKQDDDDSFVGLDSFFIE